jgi:hypothetical protein
MSESFGITTGGPQIVRAKLWEMSVRVVLREVRMPFQNETILDTDCPPQPDGGYVNMEVQSLFKAIIGFAPVLVDSRGCAMVEL